MTSVSSDWRGIAAFAVVLAASAVSPRAHANGAFADSKVILLPRGNPQRILASSEVSGLVVSDDGGATWSWICEGAIGIYARLFQLGAAPDELLYAITQAGVSISEDGGCSWQLAGGVAARASDVFADRRDPQHVIAVAGAKLDTNESDAGDSALGDVVIESHDRGFHYDAPRYMTTHASITGVEIAESAPSSRYLTLMGFELQHPYIVRSTDGGASWTEHDLSLQLERRPWIIRILAIDPLDDATLYVRLSDGNRDGLAITRDGGSSIRIVQRLDARMTAFLLRSDGALLLAAADGSAFISRDAGATFDVWEPGFHVQALAERDGSLYAVADSKLDGFAVAVSQDLGEHWRPLWVLPELRGPLACGSLPDQCRTAWAQLAPSLGRVAGRTSTTSAGAASARAYDDPRPERRAGCAVAPRRRSAPLAWPLWAAAMHGFLKARSRRRRSTKEGQT